MKGARLVVVVVDVLVVAVLVVVVVFDSCYVGFGVVVIAVVDLFVVAVGVVEFPSAQTCLLLVALVVQHGHDATRGDMAKKGKVSVHVIANLHHTLTHNKCLCIPFSLCFY